MLFNKYNKKNILLSKIIAVVFSFNSFAVPTSAFAADTSTTTKNANSTVTTSTSANSSGGTTTTKTVTRTESQEEEDYAVIQQFAAMGLNDATKLASIKAQIETAEATEASGGAKVSDATKAIKTLINNYDDSMSRMNSDGISASSLPTTKAQIAAIRTQYNKDVTDANTRCKNSGGTDCALSSEGKAYARILSTIDNQQNNNTSASSTTTNATSTNTTSLTCPTSYTLDSSAGKCCPLAQPKYNTSDGKCYATLPSDDKESSNGLQDMLKSVGGMGAALALMNSMTSKNKADNAAGKTEKENLKTYNLESNVKGNYQFSENPIKLTGGDVYFTINSTSKNNSKQHVRLILPMYFSTDVNLSKVTYNPAYVIETKEGQKTLIYPNNEDLSKSMFKKDKTSGIAIRKDGTYKLRVQYYTKDDKTGKETITRDYSIKYIVADSYRGILNDDVKASDITVSRSLDEVKQVNLSASGKITNATWDSKLNVCHISMNGDVVDNESDTGTKGLDFDVYSSKIGQQNCNNDKLKDANLVYDKLSVENSENGDSYLGDSDSKVNIDKNLVLDSKDVTSQLAKNQKLLTNITNPTTGAIYPVTVSADGKHYYHISTNEEYNIDDLSKTVGIDMKNTQIKTENGITSVIKNDSGDSATATSFDNTTYASGLLSTSKYHSLNSNDSTTVSGRIEDLAQSLLDSTGNVANLAKNAINYDSSSIYNLKGSVVSNKDSINGVDAANKKKITTSTDSASINTSEKSSISNILTNFGMNAFTSAVNISGGTINLPNNDSTDIYAPIRKKIEAGKKINAERSKIIEDGTM